MAKSEEEEEVDNCPFLSFSGILGRAGMLWYLIVPPTLVFLTVILNHSYGGLHCTIYKSVPDCDETFHVMVCQCLKFIGW